MSILGRIFLRVTLFIRTFSRLSFPAAIKDTWCDELPASLLANTEAVCSSGGVDWVTSLLRELPELQQRNREVLTEVLN